jgi:hypothetical protein
MSHDIENIELRGHRLLLTIRVFPRFPDVSSQLLLLFLFQPLNQFPSQEVTQF